MTSGTHAGPPGRRPDQAREGVCAPSSDHRPGNGALVVSSAWPADVGQSCLETACKLPGRRPPIRKNLVSGESVSSVIQSVRAEITGLLPDLAPTNPSKRRLRLEGDMRNVARDPAIGVTEPDCSATWIRKHRIRTDEDGQHPGCHTPQVPPHELSQVRGGSEREGEELWTQRDPVGGGR